MQVERDGNVAVDGDEFLGGKNGIAVLLQRLAVSLALYLVGSIEYGFDAAEFPDEVDATLVADAGSARNVVDGVAAQGPHVDNLVGRDAEHLRHLRFVEDEIILLRVEELYALVDELHHVLVAGDDEDVVALLGGAAGERANHVVGLETLGLEGGHVGCVERAAER